MKKRLTTRSAAFFVLQTKPPQGKRDKEPGWEGERAGDCQTVGGVV